MKRHVRLVWMATLAVAWAASAQAQTPPEPLVFTALPPCRILDTRPSQGGTGALAAGAPRTVHVVGSANDFAGQGGTAGGCGIPGYAGSNPQAQAVVFNFVAVSATGAGNLRAWATGQPPPNASTLNYAKVLDQTTGLPFNIANGIVIPVSQDAVEGDDLSILASVSGTDVVADVVGYFSPIFGSGVATPDNTASTIVSRDDSGDFSAGTATLSGLALPDTSSDSAGVVTLGGDRFLHNFGTDNTFLGASAGNTALTGIANTGVGTSALSSNTSGPFNSAFGAFALSSTASGGENSAFGAGALFSNTTGAANSAFGGGALNNLTSGGSSNIAIGQFAGTNLTSGSHNIYIGHLGVSSESQTIRIGSANQTATFIAGVSGQTSPSGVAVFVDGDGKLGTTTSSRRYKEGITDLAGESDVLMRLRPVAFYYRPAHDDTHTRQYGLVAEEVAEVAPQLVVFDGTARPQTVRYHFVNAMLLNEVQKQHGVLERQRLRIESQEREIEELRARLGRLEALLGTPPPNLPPGL